MDDYGLKFEIHKFNTEIKAIIRIKSCLQSVKKKKLPASIAKKFRDFKPECSLSWATAAVNRSFVH